MFGHLTPEDTFVITLNVRNNLANADPAACKLGTRDAVTVERVLADLCAPVGATIKDTATGKVLAPTDVLVDGQSIAVNP